MTGQATISSKTVTIDSTQPYKKRLEMVTNAKKLI